MFGEESDEVMTLTSVIFRLIFLHQYHHLQGWMSNHQNEMYTLCSEVGVESLFLCQLFSEVD